MLRGQNRSQTTILVTKKSIRDPHSFIRQRLHHLYFSLLNFFPSPREVWLFPSLGMSLLYYNI